MTHVPQNTFIDYKNIDIAQLTASITSLPWNQIYSLANPNDQIDLFNTLVLHLLDTHVPMKPLKTIEKPQRNKQLARARLDRDLAHKKWRRSKNPLDWEAFTSLNNKAIKIEKTDLYEKYSTRFAPSLSTSDLWRNIKQLGYKDEPTSITTHSSDDINKYYLANSTSEPSQNRPIDHPTVQHQQEFAFSNTDVYLTLRSINDIKSNAVGSDDIPPKFLKIIIPHILHYITHLFNTIFTTSIYPETWKLSKIIPIPKTPNPKAVSDYRPISLLPFLSKAFEKLASRQLQEHLERNRLLSTQQSGFRRLRNTTTALLDITEEIRAEMVHNNISIIVLLDFSKAFDTVNHDILLMKLQQQFGFERSACQLLQAYLSNRSQFVCQNSDVSAVGGTSRGVPQGSVLGPLLFSLYINDLPQIVQNSKCHVFADDVQFLVSGKERDIQTLIKRANEDIQHIKEWADANELMLNPTKTVAQALSARTIDKSNFPKITLGNQEIPFSASAKNLGIWFDERLKWDVHISNTTRKVYGSLHRLRKIAWAMPQSTRMRLVKSLIVPLFAYGCCVYSTNNAQMKSKLQSALNACTRFVFSLKKYDHISQYAKEILGCTMAEFFDRNITQQIFKIIRSQEPSYLYRRLSFSRSVRTQGLVPHRAVLEAHRGMFFVRGVKLWNELPLHLKSANGIRDFTRKLKEQ